MKLIHIIVLVVAIGLVMLYMNNLEGLCIRMPYGYVTDVPVSSFINSNMALTTSTSLGQAPLGDPRYWRGSGSPLTQGMYGYTGVLPLEATQPFNPSSLTAFAAQMPVYTDQPLQSQCTPLN